MNTTFTNAIAQLTVTDYEHIDSIIDALKDRKKELRTMKSEQAKAERDAKKAADKAAKKAIRDAEKAETKKANDAAKTLASLQTKVLKSVKKENGEVGKPKNLYYQNFCKWSKGADGPSEEDIKAAGGKRAWNKAQWDILSKDERAAPDAPWNVTA